MKCLEALTVLCAASAKDPGIGKALNWLREHQEPGGAWQSVSMNKVRKPDSIPFDFMRDAAAGYEALALLGGGGR